MQQLHITTDSYLLNEAATKPDRNQYGFRKFLVYAVLSLAFALPLLLALVADLAIDPQLAPILAFVSGMAFVLLVKLLFLELTATAAPVANVTSARPAVTIVDVTELADQPATYAPAAEAGASYAEPVPTNGTPTEAPYVPENPDDLEIIFRDKDSAALATVRVVLHKNGHAIPHGQFMGFIRQLIIQGVNRLNETTTVRK